MVTDNCIGVTGHRPKVLGFGYDILGNQYDLLRTKIKEKFTDIKPNKIITGMALGVDQLVAFIAIELDIQFIAAIPFTGQESRWPPSSKKIYNDLLGSAERIVNVSPNINTKNYSQVMNAMHLRNEWIVDNSKSLLAVWNGTKDGGTFSCIQYAESIKDYPIHIINPNNLSP